MHMSFPTRFPRRLTVGLAASAVVVTALVAPTAHADPKNSPQGRASGSFNRLATMPAYLNADDPNEPAVAEISTVTPDARTVIYTDAAGKRVGFADITDPANPKPTGTVAVDGEPTSVKAIGNHILVVVDTSDGNFTSPSGKIVVLDAASHRVVRNLDLGGQPDSIDITPDGKVGVIAMENQRDEEAKPAAGGKKGDLPQLPPGDLARIDLSGDVADWKVDHIALTGLTGIDTPSDPEPEFVSISPDGRTAAVTLQENNAVVLLDLASNEVRHFSAGSASVTGVDTSKDSVISLDGTVTAPREPDAIGWVDANHVAIANEGDWKGGTRGWSIFDTDGKLVWDAGNSFEYEAIRHGQFPEDRAGKKGAEPEGLAVATYDGTPYVFVGSERGNFVNVYDASDPAYPRFVQLLPSSNGPEGILTVPQRNLLVVSSETDEPDVRVRASVQTYQFGTGTEPAYPQIVSDDVAGKPIPWGALGALSADSRKDVLWSATDAAYADTRILKIDASGKPARITSAIPVTRDGEQASLDVEGIWANPRGGFWLGVEGADGAGNKLVQTDDKGAILREVDLPKEVTDNLGKQGIEGVTGTPNAKKLYFALQRPAKGDPADHARIGEFDTSTGKFAWSLYPLDKTSTEGDWIGLSEISRLRDGRLAVIERDKLNGPDAKIKRIYTVDEPKGVESGTLPVLAKTLAHDVLPDLRSTHGWTQEKLEGMAVNASGNTWIVTDNDGLEDATGETVFLNLGKVLKR